LLGVLLTQSSTPIIGPVAKVLGWVFNGIFKFLSGTFGIENIGLCIIIFTFLIYTFLIPMTMKQQKFSKLNVLMNPEIQEIAKKYKGKKDNDSMMKMQAEQKEIYEKYGTSPTGGCLQLLIQMPIMFALYQVIYNVPAYVTSIREAYAPLVNGIMETKGYEKVMTAIGETLKMTAKTDYGTENGIIDVLYKFKATNWTELADKFPGLTDVISDTSSKMAHMNQFIGGISIAESPMTNLLSIAILIPILSGLTQWVQVKLMPTAATNDESQMANTMKSMNVMMPLMSVFFTFTMPIGLGLYWVAGGVFRCIQQIIINKYMDRMDVEELLKKNLEKANKKREKKGLPPQKLSSTAGANARNIPEAKSPETPKKTNLSSQASKSSTTDSTELYKSTSDSKKGSIASKAGMVKKYNEDSKK